MFYNHSDTNIVTIINNAAMAAITNLSTIKQSSRSISSINPNEV
jgi:hypothetical protein